MKRFFLIHILVLIFLTSCSNEVFEEILFRTTEDPFYDVPKVQSLNKVNTIFLNWNADLGCDEFFLMRSIDGNNLSFSCIYKGKDLNYVDDDIIANTRYIYRLDKTRGKKRFFGKDYGYGFGATIRKDDCEYNDDISHATFLEYNLECSLPCVKYSTSGKQQLDCDWFYVTVPPQRTAVVVVVQKGQNISDKAATYIYQQIDGVGAEIVRQNVGFNINNSTFKTKNIYFKIYPDETKLFGMETYTSTIQYTITLFQIIPLNLQ